MSSNRTVQLLDSSITDAFGASVDVADSSNRREVETFLAGGAIDAGDWVAFDTSKTGSDRVLFVVEAAGVPTLGNSAAFGVSLDTVATPAAGERVRVRVVTAGYVEGAKVAGATVAGSPLVGPVSTAGQAEIEVPGTSTGKLCGIALEADTANVADVLVLKSF